CLVVFFGEDYMPNNLLLKLFDPGITHLHRVGLAGLYMTLQQLDPADYQEHGGWKLTDTSVEFFWNENPRNLLQPIIEKAFGISKVGVLDFFVHRKHRMSDLEKIQFHKAILGTFLQHSRTRSLAKEAVQLSFEYDQKKITIPLRPLKQYNNQKTNNIFNKKGELKKNIKLAGWAFPGGGVRHVGFSAPTTLTENVDRFLCLLFAPVGTLFFLISCKNQEGKFDQRKGAAIILPHIKNLKNYERCYRKYLHSPVTQLYANSLGDAGLSALTVLNMKGSGGMLQELEIDSCSIVTQGDVPWNKQGKSRTTLEQIRTVNRARLAFFSFTSTTLEHKLVIKEDESYYVQTSTARGLIAGNIAADRSWFPMLRMSLNLKTAATKMKVLPVNFPPMMHRSLS
ncbi:MAG: type I-MYXAN CRISPR-associated Cas8a1/Cmx1, partial [Candidatus Electrothrix sp. AR1]|nr:type I-MYXAN CRISPR-associated Cas8a1/Cmx1 [Candidatus Electrothrix sp. AR1]